MNIRFESWELLIEVSSKVEIVNDAFIKALAWDQQWNTWRVWSH